MAEEKFHYAPIIDSRFWSIKLESMKINQKNFNLDKEIHSALIDSGSSLLHAPKKYFKALIAQIKLAGIEIRMKH